MWIMFSGGILMPAIRPPRLVRPGDDKTLQVRARDAAHLRRFRRDYCPEMGRVRYTPEFDYQYRAYVSPEALAEAMTRLVSDIDYGNFKNTVEARYGDRKLHRTYLSIWGQIDEDYSGRRFGRTSVDSDGPVGGLRSARKYWWEEVDDDGYEDDDDGYESFLHWMERAEAERP